MMFVANLFVGGEFLLAVPLLTRELRFEIPDRIRRDGRSGGIRAGNSSSKKSVSAAAVRVAACTVSRSRCKLRTIIEETGAGAAQIRPETAKNTRIMGKIARNVHLMAFSIRFQ